MSNAPDIPRFLAPMAEFTSPPMRVLCEACGAQRTYTEMVNAEGICRRSEKTLFLLETFPEEQHVWAHIYGPDPDRLAEAAAYVESLGRFEGIDINAGCPVPRITSQGAGSALLKNLPRLGEIMRKVKAAVALPVSVKTRIGPHPQCLTWRETLAMAEDAGLDALAIHARFTSQGHGGTVHLDVLREIAAAARIPIYGNGSVTDAASAASMAETGVRALLIARAALDNPWVFAFTRGDPAELAERHFGLELRYRKSAERFSRLSAEEAAVLTFRRHLFRYFKGLPGSNTMRGHLMNLHTAADVRRVIAGFCASADRGNLPDGTDLC